MASNVIAFDFDGVIHQDSKGWQGGAIYDPPVPGVCAVLAELRRRGWKIAIFSVRNHTHMVDGQAWNSQVQEMQFWLAKHDVPYDEIFIGPGKPFCALFVDDRAFRFDAKEWTSEHLLKVLDLAKAGQ